MLAWKEMGVPVQYFDSPPNGFFFFPKKKGLGYMQLL